MRQRHAPSPPLPPYRRPPSIASLATSVDCSTRSPSIAWPHTLEKSAREPHPDPVQDLRDGWDLHVAFGLSHPDLFAILSGGPHQNSPLPVVESGLEVLRRRVRRIALTGRLRVSEQRAVALLHSMCVGMVLSLLREPPERRDIVTCVAAREAVLAAITGEGTSARGSGPSAAAAELRASLGQTTVLTDGERHLLEELLDRVADGE